MAIFFSILLFLMLKASVVFLSSWLMGVLHIRHDILVLGFYGFVSLFQFVFYIIQNTTRDKESGARLFFMRYATFFTFMMEIVIAGACGYYIYTKGCDLMNIVYVAVAAVSVAELFYAIHKAAFSSVIRNSKVKIRSASPIPAILFSLFAYGPVIAYSAVKLFVLKREFDRMDVYLLSASSGIHMITTLWLLWSNVAKAKRTIRSMRDIDVATGRLHIEVNDGNETGYIQSEIAILTEKLRKEKENVTLLNGYVSENILGEVGKFGLPLTGELKNATTLTVLYSIRSAESNPEQEVTAVNFLTEMIGDYAGEYDAFPILNYGRAVLVFGVPFHYEHQKYNSIECATKIFGDIGRYAEESGMKIEAHAGIFTGNVITGAVKSRGKEFNEYIVFGDGVEKSAKIAAISRKMNSPLLTCEATIEKLKSKFYVQKSYRTKISDDETLVLNQIKI